MNSSGDGKPTGDLFFEYIESDLDLVPPLNDVVEEDLGSNCLNDGDLKVMMMMMMRGSIR